MMISPYAAYVFDVAYYTWDFNFDLPLSDAVNMIDIGTTLIYLCIMIVCNSIIICQVKRKMKVRQTTLLHSHIAGYF